MGWMRIIAWDGLLPVAVVLLPALLRSLGAGDGLVALLSVMIPLIASLFRAHVAHLRIAEICDGNPTIVRQIALALAIVILLVFETLSAVLQNAKPPDWAPILVALASLYGTYLIVILWALRPLPQPAYRSFADDRLFLDD